MGRYFTVKEIPTTTTYIYLHQISNFNQTLIPLKPLILRNLGLKWLSFAYAAGWIRQAFFCPSLSPAQNLMRARAESSSEIPLSSKPEQSSAPMCNMLWSPSRSWIRFKICHRAELSQASSDFQSIGPLGRCFL